MNQIPQTSTSMMAISDTEFAGLRDLIHQRFGINLTEQKRSLLVG
ncbi:MAG: chemotaxis protein CheR, partial [Desulfuromonadales bacterium]|nr:chemotaxis protein CheR [Desulfuromonadales bacterium]